MKEVGKSTRPSRYDLNQIPCNYTVEVTNRFKGLYLIDRVPEELWMEVGNIVQEAVIKNIPTKKKRKFFCVSTNREPVMPSVNNTASDLQWANQRDRNDWSLWNHS